MDGTGKGTVVKTLRTLFGYAERRGYCDVVDGELLTSSSREHPQWKMAFRDARLVAVDEMNNKARTWNSTEINRISSGDALKGRYMHGREQTFVSPAHLIVSGNERPRIDNVGMRRRLRLVEMNCKPPSPDERLEERLRAELPAIFGWLLSAPCEFPGWSADVRAAGGAYWIEGNPLEQFFADRCVLDRDGFERTELVYESYKSWCEENGVPAWSKPTLTRRLKEGKAVSSTPKKPAGFPKTTRCYVGMRLLDDVADGG